MSTRSPALVSIVDDDESVRESLPDLVMQFGFAAVAFSSAEQFLASGEAARTACLIVDFAMPGMSGLDLMLELHGRGYRIPTVFITAQADEALRERLLQAGAAECLFKPFAAPALQRALRLALASA